MSDCLAFWKISRNPNGRSSSGQSRPFPRLDRTEIFGKVWGPSELRKDEEQERRGRLDCWNITSSQRARTGDRAHSTEEPKELRPRRQLEEQAKLEKEGKTAAALVLKGDKWAYPPSGLRSRENAFCSDYKFPLCRRNSPKHQSVPLRVGKTELQ